VRKIIIIIIVSLNFLYLKAQTFNIEPGIVVGTSYYIGDVNHSRQFYAPEFAFGLALRHNYNDFYSLRLNVLRVPISGNDADFANVYQKTRAYSFKNNLYEFGLQTEFNFLNFNSYIKKQYSPYITAGIALVAYNNFASYTAAFPFGVGYKYAPIKKMTISAEWIFRTSTSDKLDLLQPSGAISKQITKEKTNDWYSTLGITITYNFQSDKKWCPAYKKPGQK